ncbi:hypothetical protein A2814_02110 [Candidatus Nomurabacteria bacterium RIFCSPHIGHO2_01_FULL_38_19]|uniref:Uncharacterized protein n=1 Tax=Candidatus Nomurabacteria bacterium RIFCSPHIGHO2_01_FULL_38_19 TaxID=1801732 RepID=A0A1F6UUW1_9BACT|nr:MAG: hypothetical protein A2814_02110 [Candidatus Nomurabacteria bacterium RIFCSPHIGHO2_01_FULL_38_19]
MEPNFQTSFIPKKPMVKEHATASRPIGFLTIISIFVLFTMLLASGGLYFYKTIVTKNIAEMEKTLFLAKNRFEPSKITELQVLDKRLRAGSEILSKHIVISPIFQTLQLITMKTVRYTKFNYDFGGNADDKVSVKMSGVAKGYSYLALQSDLFAKNKNFIDPVFSNLSLDITGNVVFDLDFSVDPSFVDYKVMVLTEDSEGDNILNTEIGT